MPQHTFRLILLSVLSLPLAIACSSDDSGGDADGGGAATASGGNGGSGATTGTGGQAASSATGGVSSGSGGNVGAGEPAGLAGITQLHNEARATEGVPPLTWDPALAVVAQTWADACVDKTAPTGLIDHNEGRSDNYPGYVGENIYGASGSAAPQAAVSSWMSEKQWYNYASGSCASGKACGHYTQVMWAKSTKLGCGLAKCAGLKFGNAIVCNYSPGGNSGGKPF